MNTLYWASVVAASGWIYAALAASWPRLFDKEVVRHAERDPAGYRIGWQVHWRLPARAAALIGVLSAAPILAAVGLEGWLGPAVVALMAVAAIAAWIGAPPGRRLVYVPGGRQGDQMAMELKHARNIPRAVAVLLAFGVFPALVLGAMIYWLLTVSMDHQTGMLSAGPMFH